MASNPPGECCFRAVLHEGEPKGQYKVFDGVDTYVSFPSSSGSFSTVVLFLTDAFGHKFKNSQLIADSLAAHDYLVVVPDLFNGDAVPVPKPEALDPQTWLARHQPEATQQIVDKVYEVVKRDFSPQKIGVIGYCFGSKYAVRLLDGKADAGFIAHPSFVSMEEVAAIKGPLSIAAAGIDPIFPPELRRKTEDKLAEIKATFQINLYGNAEHGFAVKADINVPVAKFAKEEAFHQLVAWLNTFLKET